MALTKVSFYISLMLGFCLIVLGIMLIGLKAIDTPRIYANLDNNNINYINSYSGILGRTGINNFTDTSSDSLTGENPFSANTQDQQNTLPIIGDILGAISFIQVQLSRVSSYFNLAFHIPTFILESMGIPISGFQPYLRVITNVLFFALIIIGIALLTGNQK